jgi:hypothetical protein
MAGDRGMRYPELTKGALQHLSLPAGCTDGYSSSRTCEINMSQHSGINFRCARCPPWRSALVLPPRTVLHGVALHAEALACSVWFLGPLEAGSWHFLCRVV